MSGLDLLSVVAAMVVCVTFTGRLLAGAFDLALLRVFDPVTAAASAILGSVAWIVGYGWLSAAGTPAPRAILTLVGAHVLPSLILASRRRLWSVFRPRGSAAAWSAFGATLLVAAVLALLPVLRTGGYSICNDTYHYAAFSEWLQGAGWGTPRPFDPQSPVTYIPAIFQEGGFPLGAAYALALVQAATGASSALLVYPAAGVFGVLLNLSAVVVAARWVCRFTIATAIAVGLGFALLPHPLYWGHHNGFLQQTYALPVLLFAVAFLARALQPGQWRLGNAMLLALLVQFLLVVYLPALPALAVALVPFIVACVWRARRKERMARWLTASATCLLFLTVFGAREVWTVLRRLGEFASVVVGWHVPLTRTQFLEFALGARIYGDPWAVGWLERLRQLHLWLTPLYLGLVLLGLYRLTKRPRTWSFVAVVAFLVVTAALYSFGIRDPWTHELGHTWSLFKLTQYAYPFVYLLLTAGLATAVRALPTRAAWPGPAAALILAMYLALHWGWSETGRSLRGLVRTEAPLLDLVSIRRRFLGLPEGTLVVLGPPAAHHACLASVMALLAYPRPIVAEWQGSGHVPPLPRFNLGSYLEEHLEGGGKAVVPLLFEKPFEAQGVEGLGGGFWTMPLLPRVLRIRSVRPRDLELADGRAQWKGVARLRFLVFSPLAGEGGLLLTLTPQPRMPTRLDVESLAGDLLDRPLRDSRGAQPAGQVIVGSGQTELEVPVRLRRGLTTVVLGVEGAGADTEARLTITAATVRPLPEPR